MTISPMQLIRHATRLYPHTPYTERKAVKTLRRGWIRQVNYLGAKWLLHPDNHISKRELS